MATKPRYTKFKGIIPMHSFGMDEDFQSFCHRLQLHVFLSTRSTMPLTPRKEWKKTSDDRGTIKRLSQLSMSFFWQWDVFNGLKTEPCHILSSSAPKKVKLYRNRKLEPRERRKNYLLSRSRGMLSVPVMLLLCWQSSVRRALVSVAGYHLYWMMRREMPPSDGTSRR